MARSVAEGPSESMCSIILSNLVESWHARKIALVDDSASWKALSLRIELFFDADEPPSSSTAIGANAVLRPARVGKKNGAT